MIPATSSSSRIDDFGFLWFEDEYTISVTTKWILAGQCSRCAGQVTSGLN